MRIPSLVPGVGRAVERLWEAARLDRLPVSPKLGSMLRYGGTVAGAYLLKRGVFMPAELPMLMGEDAAEEGLRRLEPLAYLEEALRPDPQEPYAQVAVLEASTYMRNQLLRDSDWASMAHGLEVRVPFVDARLLERLAPLLCASVGKIRAKELIGAAPRRPLPTQIVQRKKSGFFVPMDGLLTDPRVGLDGYKRVPALAHPRCHWARRFAYALAHDGAADA
jgi:asparagine synthase (glutamine-hydrolysing)